MLVNDVAVISASEAPVVSLVSCRMYPSIGGLAVVIPAGITNLNL